MVIVAFIFGVLMSLMITFIISYQLEKKRLKKVEEDYLKRLHERHKFKLKPGEINEL